jgi:hypothetical protein
MQMATVLAAGLTILTTATAFLIPPNLDVPQLREERERIGSDLGPLFVTERSHTVDLDCPSCPWGGIENIDGEQIQWATQWDTSIVR